MLNEKLFDEIYFLQDVIERWMKVANLPGITGYSAEPLAPEVVAERLEKLHHLTPDIESQAAALLERFDEFDEYIEIVEPDVADEMP